MKFKDFLTVTEAFDSPVSIRWESPAAMGAGLMYVGYFEVPAKAKTPRLIRMPEAVVTMPAQPPHSDVVRYRIRAVIEPGDHNYHGVTYHQMVPGVDPAKFQTVARLMFGRWGRQMTGKTGWTPQTPRPDEPSPDEKAVFSTLIRGYGDVIEMEGRRYKKPAGIFLEAHEDDNPATFAARQRVYNTMSAVIARSLGYTKALDGKKIMLVRNDLIRPAAATG